MQKYLFLFLLPSLSLLATVEEAAQEIVQAGVVLSQAGLCPATAGNFSCRVDDLIAVTVSGKHKGRLTTNDVILVNLEGIPQGTSQKPSAETLLHTMLYNAYPDLGAVLHVHSANGIVLTRLLASESHLVTEGYEMHKAFRGISTHESTLRIPIFENRQEMPALVEEILSYLHEHPNIDAFLLRGHGLYTWGRTMDEAMNRIEALEHLFECELKLYRK